ncbi:MAG TPA: flagellar biosynthetic protein FliQ [Myxococcaceae bacterium]|jgi:flagellar biosynthesis protein FliQ|nr:flagellar biosynthetic protein FliQ [Myxococcaceae bacterium]
MPTPVLVALAREALLLMVVVSAPPVLASLVAGLLIGILQAATQLHEPTLAVVPKLAAAALALAVSGPWIAIQLSRFALALLRVLPGLDR